MAEIKKYVSLDKLTKYDTKIKSLMDTKDAAILAQAQKYTDDAGALYDAAGAAATVQGNLDNEITRAQAAEAAALKAGQDAQADVDALETLVGELPEGTSATSVVDYVNVKTAGIATDAALGELQGQLAGAQSAIDAIEADYLKAADKTELAQAIEAEATTARAAEKANADAIKAIQDDYLKGADKAELEGSISDNADAIAAVKEDVDAFFKDADMTESAKDTLKEIQSYIASDESGASQMAASIKQNADDIDALEGRMDTAEGAIDAVEGRMDTAEADIDALQAKFGEGEGSVADMIADAVAVETQAREQAIAGVQEDADKGIEDAAAALEAAQAADTKAQGAQDEVDALEQVVAGKAAQADLTALAGRVTTAEGEIDTLQSEMDAVEALAAANKAAHEANAAAIALKADKTALEAEVTRATGRENDIEAKVDAFVEVSEEEINALFPTA